MPKITYTAAKGLVQAAGSGVDVNGAQVSGILRKVYDGTTATTATNISGSYPAGNINLSMSDSGAMLLPTTASLFNLPPVATSAGFHAVFLNASFVFTSSIAAPTACIKGVVYNNTNAATLARTAYTTAQSRLTFVNQKRGDFLQISCDGTNYFVNGWCNSSTSGTI